jgi:hypothetical protein
MITEKWPLAVWCVCYRCTDYPGSWVPYSGEIFHYREAAERAAKGHANVKVKRFYLGPNRTPDRESAP